MVTIGVRKETQDNYADYDPWRSGEMCCGIPCVNNPTYCWGYCTLAGGHQSAMYSHLGEHLCLSCLNSRFISCQDVLNNVREDREFQRNKKNEALIDVVEARDAAQRYLAQRQRVDHGRLGMLEGISPVAGQAPPDKLGSQ